MSRHLLPILLDLSAQYWRRWELGHLPQCRLNGRAAEGERDIPIMVIIPPWGLSGARVCARGRR
jgi:hypothetical protein